MAITFFHRTESNRVDPRTQPAMPYDFDLPAELPAVELLAAAYALGLPRGSSRCGCFEIQTDSGIWTSTTGGRINQRNSQFHTWDQIEKSEQH